MKPRIHTCLLLIFLVLPFEASAVLKSRTVLYEQGGTRLKGYLAWNDATKEKRPGVVVVHEFWGLNEYARRRADQLAEKGYVAFAADMYGNGQVARHPEEGRALMETVRGNLETWRERAIAAFTALRAQDEVDGTRIASVGYCFGGATVLQMAYAGADLRGVASFHGALPFPEPSAVLHKDLKILILHGGSDPHVKTEDVRRLRTALNRANADYKIVVYPRAVHSFTVPEAGNDPSKGAAYDAEADGKSWAELERFLKEIFVK